MVRILIAEESIYNHQVGVFFESKKAFEVGVLVGQRNGIEKDLLLALIPTPETDQNDKIDAKWVAEHARQVTRMSPGGFEVVGFFIFGGDEKVAASFASLQSSAKRLFKDPNGRKDAYFVHISSRTKKVACKSGSISDSFASISPADIKIQSWASKLSKYECTFQFSYTLPVREDIRTTLHSAVQLVQTTVLNSHVRVDGQFVTKEVADDHLPTQKSSGKDRNAGNSNATSESLCHTVELFVPFGCATQSQDQAPAENNTPLNGQGRVAVTGTLSTRVWVPAREEHSRIAEIVKGDLVKSVMDRFDLLEDDLLRQQEDSSSPGASFSIPTKGCRRWQFPRRVLIPVEKFPVPYCDYLLAEESAEDALDRCRTLLALAPSCASVSESSSSSSSPAASAESSKSNSSLKSTGIEELESCVVTVSVIDGSQIACSSKNSGSKMQEAGRSLMKESAGNDKAQNSMNLILFVLLLGLVGALFSALQ
eukprot:TRINITY_DN1459_c0_g1::TRINITY_DN1459_c0_g1_i1::g.27182::m.27182 TRINITY_DN1459_c0_g1::TRINITY_DN1459_c0_g1_i1::g.27182  ORF type:complete len:481 (-),score=94.82,sp/Q4PJX1/ODR4_MOUSE/28.64/2e-27,ODR4-like/PF14778.1/9.6e-64 TRINITY_DN1459_c0_g1_i1:52-1494(-)